MKCAVFLRAVNVGGRNMVRMATLKEKLEPKIGRVETYLQSGNLLVQEAPSVEETEAAVRAVLGSDFALEVGVLVYSLESLLAICEASPFAPDSEDSHEFVTFVKPAIDPASLPIGKGAQVDVVKVTPDAVFSVPLPAEEQRGGYGPVNEKKLGVAATTRNWKVVRAVRDRLLSP